MTLSAGHTISTSEAKLLSPFFEQLLKNTEAGFVFFDQKPMCTVDYFQNTFFVESVDYHPLDVAVYCAKNALKNPLFHCDHIIFHLDGKNEQILIINREIFLETIKNNLPLFQYVLGPAVTPELLLQKFLSKDYTFLETLHYDRVLIGIALGYGLQNSLFESRLENILHDGISPKDTPPFSAVLNLLNDGASKELFLVDQNPFMNWVNDRKVLRPSFGFSSLQEEKKEIEQRIVISSEKLSTKTPRFIFGCLPDVEENKKTLDQLEVTQDKIRALWHSPTLLEDVLKIICQERVEIKGTEEKVSSPLADINVAIAKVFKKYLSKYDQEYLKFFERGLLEKSEVSFPSENTLGSPKIIQRATKNLEESDHFFALLKKNKNAKPILESYLYYEIIERGSGLSLEDEIIVCVDYEIFSPTEERLGLERNKELNLQETIPGFAHGLRGMKRNEKRVLYIHPAM